MKHTIGAAVLAIALSLLAAGAAAQVAYTATSIHLRAGPGTDYPVVAVLPPGVELWVQGCVEDYSWCDVVAGSERGWAYSENIKSYYDAVSGYQPLYYGAWFGIATYPFFINDYWGRHYHTRPWYRHLHRWANHRPPAWQPKPGDGAPGHHTRWPGRAPLQAHLPGGAPIHPHAPGAVPWQPHQPGAPGQRAAPIGVPRPSYTIVVPTQPNGRVAAQGSGHRAGTGAPATGTGRSPSSSGGGWHGTRGR